MNKKELNYIFYLIFILIIMALITFQIFKLNYFSRIFFLLFSLTQLFIESVLLVLLGFLTLRSKKLKYAFMSFSFTLFLFHIIDLSLLIVLDLTIWQGFDILFNESAKNLLEMFYTTGLPLYAWILFGILGLSIPLFGIFIHKITEKLSNKKPFFLSGFSLSVSVFTALIFLFSLDFILSAKIHPDIYCGFKKNLPWKITFLSGNERKIPCFPLEKLNDEKKHLSFIDQMPFQTKKTPNIFLFIIESLRNDYIEEKLSPHLFSFKKENIHLPYSFSNANATHISWFSLFHSEFPFYWADRKKSGWKSGSLPLQILKKSGYKIHIYSSAHLTYYGMNELLFGKNLYLADSYQFFPHFPPKPGYLSDKHLIEKINQDIESKELKQGNIFLIFLDSTHFPYSSPKSKNEKRHFSNFEIFKTPYRNSVRYIDQLFDQFTKKLKEENLYDPSVIIVTGDHGQEFFEEGHLFHLSHLSNMQTLVPLFYKFGNNQKIIKESKITSHIDIFPTILDYIFEQKFPFFKGESIFRKRKWPYILTARFNSSKAPYEFFLHDGTYKLILQFDNKKNIFRSKFLNIIELKDLNDQRIIDSQKDQKIINRFQSALTTFDD